MNDTHKLLLALIDALGFGVSREMVGYAREHTDYGGAVMDRKIPIYEYKLTKRNENEQSN